MFYLISNYNFFSRPTIIRNIQCVLFGHPKGHWLHTFGQYKKKPWCTWCGSKTSKKPRFRRENRFKDYWYFGARNGCYYSARIRLMHLFQILKDILL